MDKSQLSKEDLFKVESNEVAEQMGVDKPFPDAGVEATEKLAEEPIEEPSEDKSEDEEIDEELDEED